MTLLNMQTDDILGILSSVGTVSLRRTKDPVSATPGHKPHRGWTCECSVPGYHHNGGGCPIVGGAGATPHEAAAQCLTSIEAYLDSAEAVEQRKRYVDHHAVLTRRWDNATAEQRHGSFDRVHKPGPLTPEARISYE